MKKTLKTLFVGLFALCSLSAFAQSTSVEGKVYEGNLQGLVTVKVDFQSNGNAVFTMSGFGNSDSAKCKYEQDGSQIVIHGANGDMTFNQDENNVLYANIKGNDLKLICQTPDSPSTKLMNVADHIFSGNIGNGGRLTLTFRDNDVVKVSLIANNREQKEFWRYKQDGNTIIITEDMGRKITLKLNGNNDLAGMFTIFNVTLGLVK